MQWQTHGSHLSKKRLSWSWAAWRRGPPPEWFAAVQWARPVVPLLAGEGRSRGRRAESRGLEQGTGGPATASGQGPSPIPVLRPQKPLHMPGGDGHRGKSLKLLEKIPEDAEATVVLVGKEGRGRGRVEGGAGVTGCVGSLPLWSAGLARWPAGHLFHPRPGPQLVPAFPDSVSCPQLFLPQPSACLPSSFLLFWTVTSLYSIFVGIRSPLS